MLVVVLFMASGASALGGLDTPIAVPATGTPADEVVAQAAPLIDPCALVEVSIPFWEGEVIDARTTELVVPIREVVAVTEVIGTDVIDVGGLLGSLTRMIPIWGDVEYLADLNVRAEWTEELVEWHPAPLEFTTAAALGQPFVAAGYGQEVYRCAHVPLLLEPPTLENLLQPRDLVISHDQPAPVWVLDIFDVDVDVLFKAGAAFTPIDLPTGLSIAPSQVLHSAEREVAQTVAELAAQKGVGLLLHRADDVPSQAKRAQQEVQVPAAVPSPPFDLTAGDAASVVARSVLDGRLTAVDGLDMVLALPATLVGGSPEIIAWLLDQITCKDASEPDCIGLDDALRTLGRGIGFGGAAFCAVVEKLELGDELRSLQLPPELSCQGEVATEEEPDESDPAAAAIPEEPALPTGRAMGHLHAQSMGATAATGPGGLLGPLAAVATAMTLLVATVVLQRHRMGRL